MELIILFLPNLIINILKFLMQNNKTKHKITLSSYEVNKK